MSTDPNTIKQDIQQVTNVQVITLPNGKKIYVTDSDNKVDHVNIQKATTVFHLLEKAEKNIQQHNIGLAYKYYKVAANLGNADAQFNVAIMIDEHILSPNASSNNALKKMNLKNPIEDFLDNLKKAAAQKNKNALIRLAEVYFIGQFKMPKDEAKAYKYYKAAAQDGTHGMAIYNQGYCLVHGWGVTQDVQGGVVLLRTAASMNIATAKIALGECYEQGLGVEKNPVEAFKQYSAAAAQNDYRGKIALSKCYCFGIGVDKDRDRGLGIIKEISIEGITENMPEVELIMGKILEEEHQDNTQTNSVLNESDIEVPHETNNLIISQSKNRSSTNMLSNMTIAHDDKSEIHDKQLADPVSQYETSSINDQFFKMKAQSKQKRALELSQKPLPESSQELTQELSKESFQESSQEPSNATHKSINAAIIAQEEKEAAQQLKTNEKLAFIKFKNAADLGVVEAMKKVALCFFHHTGTPNKNKTANDKNGMMYLERAAKTGDSEALFELGRRYFSGLGVKKDYKNARRYFERSLEKGYTAANYFLGICYSLYGYSEEDYRKGFIMLQACAARGDRAAYVNEGICYFIGRGVEKNINNAIDIFEACLKENEGDIHLICQLASGLLLASGKKRDRKRAFILLKGAESLYEQDNTLPNIHKVHQLLARCYYKGYGIAKNDAMALEYLQKAKNRDESAHVMLALCHLHGLVVPKNTEISAKILRELLPSNHPDVLNTWGIFVYMGWNGDRANPKKAFNLFIESRNRDIASRSFDCANNIGWCYLMGLGVKQDYTEALKFFEESRKKENRCAINNLAWCHLNGLGVPKDIKKAQALFLEAQKLQQNEELASSFGLSYLAEWSLESELLKLEQIKEVEVQYNLAMCYLHGFGVPRNLVDQYVIKAYEIFISLAKEQNHSASQLQLILFCLNITRSSRNKKVYQNNKKVYQAALEISEMFMGMKAGLSNAIETRNLSAYVYLAIHNIDAKNLDKQVGKDKDIKQKALSLLKNCAEAGDPLAQFELGLLYSKASKYQEKDLKMAAELLTRSANQGYAKAQRYLGYWYERGIGVKRDIKQAFELYQVASQQCDAIAENNLGTLYEAGVEIEAGDVLGAIDAIGADLRKDEEQAFYYYERSARFGDYEVAWYNLGRCYEQGIGIKQCKTMAKECYEKAAAKGHEASIQVCEQWLLNKEISITSDSSQEMKMTLEVKMTDEVEKTREVEMTHKLGMFNEVENTCELEQTHKMEMTSVEELTHERKRSKDIDGSKLVPMMPITEVPLEASLKHIDPLEEVTYRRSFNKPKGCIHLPHVQGNPVTLKPAIPFLPLLHMKKLAKNSTLSIKCNLHVNGRLLKNADISKAFH